MQKIRDFITKVLAAWVGIGTALVLIGNSGLVDIPESWLGLFSQNTAVLLQETFDIVFQAIGAVVLAAQTIRGIFLAKEPTPEVQVLSSKDKVAYYLNPFKSIQ